MWVTGDEKLINLLCLALHSYGVVLVPKKNKIWYMYAPQIYLHIQVWNALIFVWWLPNWSAFCILLTQHFDWQIDLHFDVYSICWLSISICICKLICILISVWPDLLLQVTNISIQFILSVLISPRVLGGTWEHTPVVNCLTPITKNEAVAQAAQPCKNHKGSTRCQTSFGGTVVGSGERHC